ncbi:SDR family oxidoreductase [Hyphomonas sp.]|uniref:SDR family oxidoreductase n=1 Tax=Hyphomonas sp. TaxID=87 RepID=UPI003F711993
MSRTVPSWLEDPVAIVIGEGEGVEAVAHELAAAGATIARGPAAESHAVAAEAIAAASAAARDPVTLLVHAGGPVSALRAEKLELEAWRTGLKGGIDSRFFYATELAKSLIAQGLTGTVLFLDLPESAGGALQAATSGAVGNLTRTLAVEWARDGIRVNTIASQFVGGGTKEELRSLGALASYLVSDFAAYVTGSITGIDVDDFLLTGA